ncbi:MAG: hypothetical protein IJ484_00010 [Oscillospiraceae bacterium]|nr:hypothetical protein [Oscillospiraceae bacterium]
MELDRFSRHRTLSELPYLQRAARMEYTAALEGEGIVRFGVYWENSTDSRSDTLRIRGVSKELAKSILIFLYENAVTMESWRDVLEDATVCLREQMEAPQILPEP